MASSSPGRRIKRPRGSESPVYLSSCSLVTPEEARLSRQRFFDALEAGSPFPGMGRPVSSADHLSEAQLKKLFDVLHACGCATDDEASLAATRASVDGFLDAVFHSWTSQEDPVRPDLDFLAEAEVVAGRICTSQHDNLDACIESGTCAAVVSASISYSCNPAMVKMEFTAIDRFTGQPEALCPLGRDDIRWVATGWQATLRQTLESRIVARLHKYNKHLAVWQARRLIHAWSRGSVDLGVDVGEMGFLGKDAAAVVLPHFGVP